jgi:hypothetical protein
VQVILSLDANFQQKHNPDKARRKEHWGEAGTRHPPVFSPPTIILPHHFVEEWDRKDRDSHMGMHSRPAKKTNTRTSDYAIPNDPTQEDVVEPGMNVLNSSLNACNDSFVAADGDRIKASTQYFDDTGLMAILCRHDRPFSWQICGQPERSTLMPSPS